MGRRCIIGQSGGPIVAINATLAGIISNGISKKYDKVFGMVNGLSGFLDDQIIELSQMFEQENMLEKLKHTPAMYLGSCRFKIPCKDDSIKQQIIDKLIEYKIDDFYYIGGNDSMDTIKQMAQYAKEKQYPIHFIGVPKTIDNDLLVTDYTPGYPSACKYVATSLLEIALDNSIYPLKSVTIVEIMGRDAGWLTAASQLVNEKYPNLINLIYLPEMTFDEEEFIEDVKKQLRMRDSVIIAVSEGIKDQYGMCVSLDSGIQVDAFGHMSNSGSGDYLKNILVNQLNIKVRSIQLSTLQRCSSHLESQVDIDNAFSIGSYAVECALNDLSGVMVCIKKDSKNFVLSYVDVCTVANKVKLFPLEWIDTKNKQIRKNYIDYIVPFIYASGKIELPDYLMRG